MHEAGILRCCWTLLVHFPSARSATLRLYPDRAARCRVRVVISIVCLHYFCFLFRDFALEACCWPSCADFQCDQCHVGMDALQRANHTDLPEGGGQVRHTSPDLRKTNRSRIFRLSIQKNVLPIRRITIMKLHFIKGILLYHYSLILYETLM